MPCCSHFPAKTQCTELEGVRPQTTWPACGGPGPKVALKPGCPFCCAQRNGHRLRPGMMGLQLPLRLAFHLGCGHLRPSEQCPLGQMGILCPPLAG